MCLGVGVLPQVLRSGTLADKVAALTLQVQESPVHRLGILDRLLDLGVKKERRTVGLRYDRERDRDREIETIARIVLRRNPLCFADTLRCVMTL